MENKWRKVWEKRSVNEESLNSGEFKKVFLELKRINGFDSIGELSQGVGFDEYYGQYQEIKNELEYSSDHKVYPIKSLFEVGCGSGANLYLAEREGLSVGGIDYSKAEIEIAGKVLNGAQELICDEAANLSSETKYDAILSNSVFSYFQDYDYAKKVLDIMYDKAEHAIGIIDVHDIDKKEAFLQYRRSISEDYEERYQGLSKLFYDRSFFLDFAKEHQIDIKFKMSRMKGYWNNDFVFNCFLWKVR